MNYLRRKKAKELREPEKTALIDIIFLLLIFFFVSLTVSEPGFHAGKHPKPTPPHRERELLKIIRPTEHTSRYLFIQVINLKKAPAEYLEVMNDLRTTLTNLSGSFGLGLSFGAVPETGFMVMTDFVENNLHLYDIESMLKEAGELEEQLRDGMTADLRARAALLCDHYATFFPDIEAPNFLDRLENAEYQLESVIENTLRSVESAESETPDVLVNMPKTTYLYFLKSLYAIMGRGSLAEQDIRVQAIEERT